MTAQKQINKKKSFFKGFTLIELLIVITIIGILATFVIASFATAQAKARDSRRKSNLDADKKALELFKGDTSGGSIYPSCAVGTNCLLSAVTASQVLTPTYIATIPAEVNVGLVGLGYTYQPLVSPGGAACAAAALTCGGYKLTACLENSKDASADTTTFLGCITKSYTISNP